MRLLTKSAAAVLLLVGLVMAALELRLSGPLGMSAYVLQRAGRELVRDALIPTPPSLAGFSNEGPNVLVVVLDCYRFDYVERASPNLHELARNAWRYQRYFAAAPWTKPSTASLFTGLQVRKHFMMLGGGEQLPQEALTLAEMMRGAGFRTAGFVWNPHLSRRQAFDQGFDHYVDDAHRGSKSLLFELFDWLDRERPERFFAYIHFQGTHDPYYVDNDLRAVVSAPAYDGNLDFSEIDYKRAVWDGEIALTPEQAAHLRHLAEGKARRVDREAVGGLLERFEGSGLHENTLLVITSDHGDAFAEHDGAVSHGKTIYNEEIHVPLVIRYPKAFAADRGFPEAGDDACPASTVDLLPTVWDFVGASARSDVDGVSLVPGEARRRSCSRPVISEMTIKTGGIAGAAVMAERHKLIVDYADGAPRLFDLEQDMGETRDLSDLRVDEVTSLEAELSRRLNADGSSMAEWDAVRGELTDEQREELRLLGYLE